jgi:ABC-type Mn2+/Zn2+ transport system ATPase subunit
MMSLARNENAPDFVCLDEVFAPVDTNGKKAMFDVIAKLQEYFRMVLVISHDAIIQETIKDTIVVNMVNDTSTIQKQAFEH